VEAAAGGKTFFGERMLAVVHHSEIDRRFGSYGAHGAREKNLTFSRNDTGAVMYPAVERSRLAAGPDVIR
jgi:hypothetical protein